MHLYFSFLNSFLLLNIYYNVFTGERCEKVSPCVHSPCGEGQCEQKGEGHICHCPDSTTRIQCDDGMYDVPNKVIVLEMCKNNC